MQALLLVALISGILRAALAAGVPDRVLVMLISPAFLPFWSYDYLGAMRKEMVALLAFVPLLRPAATLAGARLRAHVAIALHTLAVAFHEANAFLAPFFAAALWFSIPPALPRRAYIGAVFAIAGPAMVVVLLFSTVDDPAAVCREITDHGLREGLCRGAIDWLGFDLGRVFHEGRSRLATFGIPWSALLSYTLAILPIVAALWQAPRRGLLIAATLASGLALAPLYVVALDWGRWIFLHTACVTLVILTAANHRSLPWLHRPLDHRILVFLLASSALWSMGFFTGESGPGLVPQLILATLGR